MEMDTIDQARVQKIRAIQAELDRIKYAAENVLIAYETGLDMAAAIEELQKALMHG
jgi:hypothetical protein